MSKKRVNPKRQTITMSQYEANRLVSKATDQATERAIRLFLYVLIDKRGFKKEDIPGLTRDINYVADSVSKGYISWNDIDKMLDSDYDVQIEIAK